MPASNGRPLQRAAESLLALVLARAEFASVELSLALQKALRWLLAALAACALGMLALIAISATLVVALWGRLGWYTVALLAILYSLGTAAIVWRLLRVAMDAPPLLAQTFEELAKDRAALAAREPVPTTFDQGEDGAGSRSASRAESRAESR